MRCCLFIIIILITYLSASAQLNADFSAVSVQGCSPFTVQFRDNSTGSPTQWFWDFGNGVTSFSQNPTVTYETGGNYTVRLIVRNAAEEDFEQKANYITVYSTPQVGFSVSGDSGCAPLQTSFKDTSDLFNASAKSWFWDFGDGSTSNQQNPTHTFATGKYDVLLTVETTQGCVDTLIKRNAVAAGNKPTANFSAGPLTGCASAIRNFKNNSSGTITASAWNFGDSGISFDQNPEYHYQDTGTFSVKLRVSENGCEDSITIPNYIHVDGPVAKFLIRNDCSERFTFYFNDNSIGERSRKWKFGDGKTSSDSKPIYVYSSPGIYNMSLIITGGACTDTAREAIHIKATTPVLEVSPVKSFYCKYDSLQLSIKNYDTADTKSFQWNFDDGVFRGGADNPIISHVYDTAGNFRPSVYIRNSLNCRDTVTLAGGVIINGPAANFLVNANGCTNSPVTFQDRSGATGSQITQWLWSYGDGTTSNTQNPPNYLYAFPGTYNPYLKVRDANNCVDSIMDIINIFQSPIVDAGADTFACAGSPVQLTATGATTYTWKNDNNTLSCTNCANPFATPTQPETYFVTGKSNGCSASDSVKIKVQTKELLTAQPASFEVCEGNSINLNVNGTDNYSWLPDNTLSSTTIKNPVANPVMNTIYTAIGKDSNNCFSDTARINVTVHPKPTVNITDSAAEVLSGSAYTILASAGNDGIVNLEWTPASGLSCYNCLQPTTTVNNTITYTLTATNAFGCTASDSIILVALCNKQSIYIPNTFSPNNDGINDVFYPRANGSLLVKSFIIFNRWGQVVFEKRNAYANGSSNGWDGKYKNVLQRPDVYVYIMELQCANDETFVQRGNITLIR